MVSLTGVSGAMVILHALASQRVLTFTGAALDSSVIISGLTFAGGHAVGGSCPAGFGGAILITAAAQQLLINLTIRNSVADTNGGRPYDDTGSPLTLSGVAVLTNTSSIDGDGVWAKRCQHRRVRRPHLRLAGRRPGARRRWGGNDHGRAGQRSARRRVHEYGRNHVVRFCRRRTLHLRNGAR